jgi:hypothetical protein
MHSKEHGSPTISASCVAKMLHYILTMSCVCLAPGQQRHLGNRA